MKEEKKLNERTGNQISIEELDAQTNELISRAINLKKKVMEDTRVAIRLHQKAQNENK